MRSSGSDLLGDEELEDEGLPDLVEPPGCGSEPAEEDTDLLRLAGVLTTPPPLSRQRELALATPHGTALRRGHALSPPSRVSTK